MLFYDAPEYPVDIFGDFLAIEHFSEDLSIRTYSDMIQALPSNATTGLRYATLICQRDILVWLTRGQSCVLLGTYRAIHAVNTSNDQEPDTGIVLAFHLMITLLIEVASFIAQS